MNGWTIFAAFLFGSIVSVIGAFRFIRWLFDGELLP